ncbi:ent-kaur-16-ene synthase [Hirsutella rhossiliensis]
MAMNNEKMSRFKPESLYEQKPSSAIHSLEAFVGKIDFDQVSHHLWQGSMMASPSSTAAYLIHASHWDEEAEAYLRHVIKAGAGHGSGGIPGTFPITHFEYSWVLATLLRSGFSKLDLECAELQCMANTLRKAFEEEGGIIGFAIAPRAPDVDDTAKGLLALSLLDHQVSPDRMIEGYEGQDHFITFGSERDPSLTSNCHVLVALLHQPDVSCYHSQILKTTKYICGHWWSSDCHVKDKWHLSHLYPTMLLAEAFTLFLELLDGGALSDIVSQELHSRVCISLFQACFRTLMEQEEDGSWGGLPEQTCYAILTLAEARKGLFFRDLLVQIQAAIDRGVLFLDSRDYQRMDHGWASKTAYRVAFVAEAYEIAALNVPHVKQTIGAVGHSLPPALTATELNGYTNLVRQTPLFSRLPDWVLRGSLVESSLFIPLLRAQRLKVFDRDEIHIAEDKYLNIIPFTWIGCNNRIDELIEAVASPAIKDVSILHELIDQIIDGTVQQQSSDPSNNTNRFKNAQSTTGDLVGSNSLAPQEVSVPLTRFVAYVLNHELVLTSSAWDRQNLYHELRAFLHAHATQAEENSRFEQQGLQNNTVYTSARRSFFNWVPA